MNDILKKSWQCPHPFCNHQREPLTIAEIRRHYSDNHKCGPCNHGRHHKCKNMMMTIANGQNTTIYCGCNTCWTKVQISERIDKLQRDKSSRVASSINDTRLGIVKRAT